ncbi:hypothetical protein MNBD_GAMMA10-2712 [hydrothermal vent metagenome]|uniref:Uncharacterized protein n=1 Tax=hydrothermal vent metagenome TaxID=652676 RepID=A0A3B0XQN2_9ZZZZ
MILLTLIGLSTILGVFSGSMSPSERARSERSQHDIKKIEPGSYLLVSFKRKTALNDKVLIIKDWSGNLYVHLLPTKNKTVSLPDRYWGWAVYGCKDFGPETDKNNNIIKNGSIKCHDTDMPEWFDPNQWLWSYSGKAAHEWLPNMFSPKYEIKEDILFING